MTIKEKLVFRGCISTRNADFQGNLLSVRQSTLYCERSQKSKAQLKVELYPRVPHGYQAAGTVNQGSCLGPVFSGILNGWKAGGIQKTTPLLKSLTSLGRPHYQAK